MAGLPRSKNVHYTWDDYRTWSDDGRWEIIGGEAFDMTPAPLVRHQHVSTNLTKKLGAFFDGKPCRLYHSPIDLRLSEDTIVQPDLLVVCNPEQIRETHIEGPPTLVIEITSPSSLGHDRLRKFNLYARFGVQEYWLVTPYPSLIEVWQLAGDTYRLHSGYEKRHTLKSAAFADLELVLDEIFDFPVDPSEEVRMVRETTPPFPARSQREAASAT